MSAVSKDFDDPRLLVRHPGAVSSLPGDENEVSLFFHDVGTVKVYVTLPVAKAKELCNSLYTSIQKADNGTV